MRSYKIFFSQGQVLLVHMDCGTGWPMIEGSTLDVLVDTVIGHSCPDPTSPKGRIVQQAREHYMAMARES
jgi:hypothetical protein